MFLILLSRESLALPKKTNVDNQKIRKSTSKLIQNHSNYIPLNTKRAGSIGLDAFNHASKCVKDLEMPAIQTLFDCHYFGSYLSQRVLALQQMKTLIHPPVECKRSFVAAQQVGG